MSDPSIPGGAPSNVNGVPAGSPASPPPPAPPYPAPPVPPYAHAGSAPPGGAASLDGYGRPFPAYAPPEGYAPPPQGYGPYVPQPPRAAPRGGTGLGTVAFVLALLAAIGASVVASIAAFNIGLGTGREIILDQADAVFDWSILTPVRGWVLLGEVAFWLGTVIGVWALVQGIVATVKNRGRGWAIAAIVIAVIGPIAFATAVQAFLLAGFASGASVGG